MRQLVHAIAIFAAVAAAQSARADIGTTRFVSFKAYEEFTIKTVDGHEVVLAKGQLTPRPVVRPTGDWRVVGASFGMKENARFCNSKEIDDMLKMADYLIAISELSRTLRQESRHQLTAAEAKQLAATPLCGTYSETIVELGQRVPYLSEAPANNSGRGIMIDASTVSDEGHGWLVINNHLSDGSQALIHTGHKIKNALNYFEGFLAKPELTVSGQITKQPFSLSKGISKSTSVKTGESSRSRRCTTTVYRNRCEYDPVSGRGICREVPYSVEGWEDVTTTTSKETRVNDIQIMSSDGSRALGVLQLETTFDDYNISSGDCKTLDIPDHDDHSWPFPSRP